MPCSFSMLRIHLYGQDKFIPMQIFYQERHCDRELIQNFCFSWDSHPINSFSLWLPGLGSGADEVCEEIN